MASLQNTVVIKDIQELRSSLSMDSFRGKKHILTGPYNLKGLSEVQSLVLRFGSELGEVKFRVRGSGNDMKVFTIIEAHGSDYSV